MCLAVPARVLEVDGEHATVEVGGVRCRAALHLVSDVRMGDYLVVHAGLAIQVLDEHEALETLRLLEGLVEVGR